MPRRKQRIRCEVLHGHLDAGTQNVGTFTQVQLSEGQRRVIRGEPTGKQHMFDPQGVIEHNTEEEAMSGTGYPVNSIFWIAVIEDPVATLDPKDQKPPRFALSPKEYLAPSIEVAFLMAGKELAEDVDLQRCRVRVGQS